jgi:Tfp pilus assembly protein PilN
MLVISAVTGLYCIAHLNENRKESETLASIIKQHQDEISRLKGEGEKVQQQLSSEQKALLTASHKLVANKKFGWSRLFSDLESVLPGNVSASRIAVQNVYQDGDRLKAELEFGVLSRDYTSVQTMLENMNNSRLFQAELRGQNLQQSERVTYTEYTFRVIYTPAYGYAAPTTNDVAQNIVGGRQ